MFRAKKRNGNGKRSSKLGKERERNAFLKVGKGTGTERGPQFIEISNALKRTHVECVPEIQGTFNTLPYKYIPFVVGPFHDYTHKIQNTGVYFCQTKRLTTYILLFFYLKRGDSCEIPLLEGGNSSNIGRFY